MQHTEIIIDHLGFPGRMISGSKSGYMQRNPEHLVVFNANICTDTEKIWYGDLDITKDAGKLQAAATEMKCRIYILREHDARFENEAKPRLDQAVVIYEP